MYPYCSNLKLYKCPTGVRGEVVTYAIVDAMNGALSPAGSGGPALILRNRMQIRRPSDRAVFVDEGRMSPSSWSVWYDREQWFDQIYGRRGS